MANSNNAFCVFKAQFYPLSLVAFYLLIPTSVSPPIVQVIIWIARTLYFAHRLIILQLAVCASQIQHLLNMPVPLEVNRSPGSHQSSDSVSGDVEKGAVNKNVLSPDEVNWLDDTDQANPMNWTASLKWRNLGIISIMSLATYVLCPSTCTLVSTNDIPTGPSHLPCSPPASHKQCANSTHQMRTSKHSSSPFLSSASHLGLSLLLLFPRSMADVLPTSSLYSSLPSST